MKTFSSFLSLALTVALTGCVTAHVEQCHGSNPTVAQSVREDSTEAAVQTPTAPRPQFVVKAVDATPDHSTVIQYQAPVDDSGIYGPTRTFDPTGQRYWPHD